MNDFWIVLHQSWVLLWYKNVKINWRLDVLTLLANLLFDILVPSALLYIFTCNMLYVNIERMKKFDDKNPMSMEMTIEKIFISMLLPMSFFLFARRIIGGIVEEKEKGMLDYLRMNGMS